MKRCKGAADVASCRKGKGRKATTRRERARMGLRRRKNVDAPKIVELAAVRAGFRRGGGAHGVAGGDALGGASTNRSAAIHLHQGGGQRRGRVRPIQLRVLGDQ